MSRKTHIMPKMTRKTGWDRNRLKWEPEDGEPMFIKDIPLEHFVNIMNWIWDNFDIYENKSPGLYKFMEGEARFRRLLALAGGGAYPDKVGDRYQVKE